MKRITLTQYLVEQQRKAVTNEQLVLAREFLALAVEVAGLGPRPALLELLGHRSPWLSPARP